MEDGDGETSQHGDSSAGKKNASCSSDQVTDNVLPPVSDGPTTLPRHCLAEKHDTPETASNRLLDTASEFSNSGEIDVPKVKVNGDVNSSECCDISGLNSADNNIEKEAIASEQSHKTLSTCIQEELDQKVVPISEKSRKRKIFETPVLNDINNDCISSVEDNVEFKGFKKRILAQASITADSINDLTTVFTGSSTKTKKVIIANKRISPVKSKKKDGEPSTPQAEYAQYLGLQPTVKFKCYKCEETGFPSMHKLQEHQNTCLNNLKIQSAPKALLPHISTDSSPSTNFRITRKVYLCSSCGTYYENWNLFLHMRQVHKRHICLVCLSMFVQAEKLAAHLTSKHGLLESLYTTPEQLFSECSSSCFLMCISCENVFTERDDFSNHVCKDVLGNPDHPCSLCHIRGGSHLPSCHLLPSTNSSVQPNLITGHSSNYVIPISSVNQLVMKKKQNTVSQATLEKNVELSDADADDDYDICNAASFCHVNIDESPEKLTSAVVANMLQAIPEPILSSSETKEEDVISQPERSVSQSEDISVSNKNDCNMPCDKNLGTLVQSPATSPKTVSSELPHIDLPSGVDLVTASDLIPDANLASPKNSPMVDEPLLGDSVAIVSHPETESSPDESLLKAVTPPSIDFQIPSPPTLAHLSESSDRIPLEDITPLVADDKVEETMLVCVSPVSKSPNIMIVPESPSSNDVQKDSDNLQTTDVSSIAEAVEALLKPECNDTLVANITNQLTDVVPQALKRSQRRRVIRSWAPKPRAKVPQKPKPKVLAPVLVAVPAKTPLTLKFIKTSSTENANYRTAIDGNLLEFDNSDYDTTIPDPLSSPESSGKPEELLSDPEADALQAKLAEEQAFMESIQLAGDDVSAVDIYFEDKLESLKIQVLLQECVKAVCLNCVYCCHAKKIAVNGKQLALHLLAEHRFIPVYKKESSFIDHLTVDAPINPPDDMTIRESDQSENAGEELFKVLVMRLKSALPDLQELFLNTETYDSSDRTFMRPYDRTYECFQCNFLTTLHKDLYVHNRKMHQKTILLCIMCKSNFYSYSELLCHLCPGIYIPDNEIKFRCCVCIVDLLPSAFRLMVHLRKRHHCCDVCLELTDDQQKLSNHVWKHKLHHLCYRCGIAYRNKPDITKHLFWKHGTESVLCKKCLQKKWPHVYHFCMPPNAFICEECNASFTRAVSLKVHKRLHSGDLLYGCEECEERFVSKKLLAKHQDTHREVPVEVPLANEKEGSPREVAIDERVTVDKEPEALVPTNGSDLSESKEFQAAELEIPVPETLLVKDVKKKSKKKPKAKVVDVYDLPPLNLSSDSDDSADEKRDNNQGTNNNLHTESEQKLLLETTLEQIDDALNVEEESYQPVQTVDGVWDNFQNYKANLERRESHSNESFPTVSNPFSSLPFPLCSMDPAEAMIIVMGDHDYCGDGVAKQEPDSVALVKTAPQPCPISDLDVLNQSSAINLNSSLDHDYCWNQSTPKDDGPKEEEKPILTADQDHNLPQSKESPVKKKQKPSKKSKRTMSSSSSDSSSSGSSSCSCKTNCSCSSSSSSSSGSSSDSSESDSSTSEGRRLQIARREQRREARKKAKDGISTASLPTNNPTVQEAEPPTIPAEPEVFEEPIRESDLETDETETDEDFYDQHPQLLANKLMAEKRNQLLLLAAVAPGDHIMTPPESLPPPSPEQAFVKKKNKSKKRKKRQHEAERKAATKVRLNTSSSYCIQPLTTPERLQPPVIYPPAQNAQFQPYVSPLQRALDSGASTSAAFSAESGSETDSKRLSKRMRLPKKFYGDSSDEDSSTQPKWPSTLPLGISSPAQSVPLSPVLKPVPLPPPVQARVPPIIIVPAPADPDDDDDNLADSESEQEEVKKSSTDSSSNSEPEKDDTDVQVTHRAFLPAPVDRTPGGQRNDNLYCYCQCPYDEVSEMIACDGKDCTIEWFHFECVGIMVPPRGKWFCPDCRRASTTKTL